MKPKYLVMPAVALTVLIVMLGKQWGNVSELRDENEQLRKRIAAAKVVASPSDPSRPGRSKPSGKLIDFDQLASLFREGPDGAARLLSVRARLLEMDSSTLLAELDRLAAMDFGNDIRTKMELMILDPLCTKDPAAAMDRFKGKIEDTTGMCAYLLTGALTNWLKQDQAAATAWLDLEAEAGTFDSKTLDGVNTLRQTFESMALFDLFPEDPAQAEARLSKLSPALRMSILYETDNFYKMGESDEITLAAIVRRQFGGTERVEAISMRARKVLGKDDDFSAVDKYLDRIEATPDERQGSVKQAASRFLNQTDLSAEKIEDMRQWVGRDAPESVDQLTSEALVKATEFYDEMDAGQVFDLVRQYHERASDDDFLSNFLNKFNSKGNDAAARSLAEKISDPVTRERLLGRFK